MAKYEKLNKVSFAIEGDVNINDLTIQDIKDDSIYQLQQILNTISLNGLKPVKITIVQQDKEEMGVSTEGED